MGVCFFLQSKFSNSLLASLAGDNFFFPFVMEKDGKTCFNAETNDLDQQTVCGCGAPICWLKYTTPYCPASLVTCIAHKIYQGSKILAKHILSN